MKQVVTETWVGDNVKIDLSYDFDPQLIGKKEREEFVFLKVFGKTEKKIVKYWVNVANDGDSDYRIPSFRRKSKVQKRIERIRELQLIKNERLKRYQKEIESGEGINPTEDDFFFGTELQKLIGRQAKTLAKG